MKSNTIWPISVNHSLTFRLNRIVRLKAIVAEKDLELQNLPGLRKEYVFNTPRLAALTVKRPPSGLLD